MTIPSSLFLSAKPLDPDNEAGILFRLGFKFRRLKKLILKCPLTTYSLPISRNEYSFRYSVHQPSVRHKILLPSKSRQTNPDYTEKGGDSHLKTKLLTTKTSNFFLTRDATDTFRVAFAINIVLTISVDFTLTGNYLLMYVYIFLKFFSTSLEKNTLLYFVMFFTLFHEPINTSS